MKTVLTLLLLICILPVVGFSADYQMFSKDIQKATQYWKQSVALTSKRDKEKTAQVLNSYILEWKTVSEKYMHNVPKEFPNKTNFQSMLKASMAAAQKALKLTQKGEMKKAHDEVEVIRYLIWEQRAEAQIFPLIDDLNGFHELMEIVLEQAEMSETPEEFSTIVNRHGYWLKTEWLQIGHKVNTTTKNSEYKKIVADGLIAIDTFLTGARKADIDMVDPAAHKIKKNFKKLFFAPEIY